MLDVYAYTTQGCETCGHGSRTYGTVKIHCEHCKKLIYQKDFDNE